MASLTEFLLARIAEDDVAASLEVGRRDVILTGAFAPAFILAECDAKRRIVEAESRSRRTKENVCAETRKAPDGWVYVRWLDEDYRPHDERVSADEFRERFTEPLPPSGTLKFLALPYADHPDYRQAWRP